MKNLGCWLRGAGSSEEGKTLIECALLLSLMTVAAIVVLGLLATDIDGYLNNVRSVITPP